MKYAEPFPHWVVDDFFDASAVQAALEVVPPGDWPGWVRYSSAWESNKRTARAGLPGPILQLAALVTSLPFTKQLREWTGIADLIPTPFMHGGGMHVTDYGGRLDPHLDFAVHPDAPFLERRVSTILFLNDGPGGVLQLWDDDVTKVVAEIEPKAGRLAVFQNSDLSYHGVTEWLGSTPRVTIATYFCGPLRCGVVRRRALWCPVRDRLPTTTKAS